tara:strand:- start:375 stop:659 length:285 start_codon:yes stop_codon:yes gene_type:complete
MDVPTIDILQNLKGVLQKIMGNGEVRKKYTNALEVAIAQLTLEAIFVETDFYRVDVEAKDDGILITVATSDGDLLEEYEYTNGEIIGEDNIGEA